MKGSAPFNVERLTETNAALAASLCEFAEVLVVFGTYACKPCEDFERFIGAEAAFAASLDIPIIYEKLRPSVFRTLKDDQILVALPTIIRFRQGVEVGRKLDLPLRSGDGRYGEALTSYLLNV